MALTVRLRAIALDSPRCAFCHDGVALERFLCPRCSTILHADCRELLRRCPTLGCAPPPITIVLGDRRPWRFTWVHGAVAALVVFAIFVALVVAFAEGRSIAPTVTTIF